MNDFYFLTEILLVTCAFLVFNVIRRRGRRPEKYPPGPFPLPIIGNLHNLGLKPYRTLTQLREKYGDVYAIDLGGYKTIVLNGNKILKKYLNMNQTAGRPHLLPLVGRSEDLRPRGIIATYGEVWVEQRRFVLKNLRDFGFGKKSMEGMILDEVDEIIGLFDEAMGKPIVTQHLFQRAVVNSLYTICTGQRASKDDKEFETILTNVTEFANAPMMLTWFFPQFAKTFPKISGYDKMVGFCGPMMEIFKSKYESRNNNRNEKCKDLIDCYINEIQDCEQDPASSFYKTEGERNMLMSLLDIFGAGAETTSTTLTWVLLIVALNPKIQAKLHEEIDTTIGNAKPSLSHREKMPFFQSLILEVLRYSTIAPLGVFHATMETMEIEGYLIPKGTIITTNLFGAHRDKEVWGDDAEEFIAERFLTKDGQSVDRNKAKYLIAFSTGKRICPGETVAKDSLFLFVTSIFQKFRVTTNPDRPRPTLDFHMGSTLSPLSHEIIFQLREAS